MLAAVAVWAAYSLMLRRRPADLPPSVALAASVAAALLMMLPLLLLDPANPFAALGSPGVLLSIGYIALFASAIAFLLWSRGVSELGPVRAGQFVQFDAGVRRRAGVPDARRSADMGAVGGRGAGAVGHRLRRAPQPRMTEL